jgi:4-hydroxybenzoate-CoA ligase
MNQPAFEWQAPGREYNAAIDFIDRNVGEGRGDKPAFIDPDATLTYSGLLARSCQFANLTRELGLDPETRLAQIMLDSVDFPAVFFGAIRAGVVPIPINTLLAPDQHEYILRDSRAQALVISAPLLDALADRLADIETLKHIIVAGGGAGGHAKGHRSFEQAMDGQGETFEPAKTCADDTAFWLYSSGSTGMPKGVRHVQTAMIYTAKTYGDLVLGIREDDVAFSAAKLFFAYGLGNSMSFPMAVGATTILFPGRPTPDAMMTMLKAHNPTLFFGVPTLYAAMLADDDCAPENGSDRLRLCISAGEALPEEIGNKWQDRFGVEILDGVGSTEMLHIFLSNREGDVRYGTSGEAVPGYQLKLVDETLEPVEAGEIGELLVSGLSSADSYWNQREKSRATFAGQWTLTGDKYYQDKDGRYHYCGRTDDMFKVSGIWLSPFEVESALVTHDGVLEAAVVPYDDDGLLKPKAFVILNQGTQPGDDLKAALKDHVKAGIGKWKYPREIEFVNELPKTATGKIQRFKLR